MKASKSRQESCIAKMSELVNLQFLIGRHRTATDTRLKYSSKWPLRCQFACNKYNTIYFREKKCLVYNKMLSSDNVALFHSKSPVRKKLVYPLDSCPPWKNWIHLQGKIGSILENLGYRHNSTSALLSASLNIAQQERHSVFYKI